MRVMHIHSEQKDYSTAFQSTHTLHVLYLCTSFRDVERETTETNLGSLVTDER